MSNVVTGHLCFIHEIRYDMKALLIPLEEIKMALSQHDVHEEKKDSKVT